MPTIRRTDLTPSAIALAAWCAIVVSVLLKEPMRAAASYLETDWISFATGGRLLHQGAAAHLFDTHAQLAVQTDMLGRPPVAGLDAYPLFPLFAWVISPLAALPIELSTRIWVGLMGLCLVATVLVVKDLLPNAWPLAGRMAVGATAVLTLPMIDSLAWGQVTPLLLLLLALAVRRLALHGDGVIAGILLGAVGLKPQLIWLAVPCLLAGRLWRTAAGVGAAAAAWGVSTLALVGVDGVRTWMTDLIPNQYVGQTGLGSSIPSLLSTLGMGDRVAFAAALLVAAVAMALVWRHRERLGDSPATLVALGVVLSAVCSPHAFPRDLALVGVLLVLQAPARPAVVCGLTVLLGIAYLANGSVNPGHDHLLTLTGLGVTGVAIAGALSASRMERLSPPAWLGPRWSGTPRAHRTHRSTDPAG